MIYPKLRRPTIFLVLGIMLCTSFISLLPRTVFAATGSIYLSPSSISVQTGASFVVTLRINPGAAVDGVQATVTFDKTKLSLNSVDSSNSPFTVSLQQDQTATSIAIARGALSSTVSTDALVTVLSFSALSNAGSTALIVSDANATSGGAYTNPSSSGATVVVTAPVVVAPVATTTPAAATNTSTQTTTTTSQTTKTPTKAAATTTASSATTTAPQTTTSATPVSPTQADTSNASTTPVATSTIDELTTTVVKKHSYIPYIQGIVGIIILAVVVFIIYKRRRRNPFTNYIHDPSIITGSHQVEQAGFLSRITQLFKNKH